MFHDVPRSDRTVFIDGSRAPPLLIRFEFDRGPERSASERPFCICNGVLSRSVLIFPGGGFVVRMRRRRYVNGREG